MLRTRKHATDSLPGYKPGPGIRLLRILFNVLTILAYVLLSVAFLVLVTSPVWLPLLLAGFIAHGLQAAGVTWASYWFVWAVIVLLMFLFGVRVSRSKA